MHEDLIYDIGVHVGEDTDYYLRKGFRVVGIDETSGGDAASDATADGAQ